VTSLFWTEATIPRVEEGFLTFGVGLEIAAPPYGRPRI